MTVLADHVLRRQQDLARERQTWEQAWSEIADFVLPRRAIIGSGAASSNGRACADTRNAASCRSLWAIIGNAPVNAS